MKIQAFITRALLPAAALAVNAVAAMTPAELAGRLARNEPLLIIDVRSAIAYEAGHVPGAINIPLGLLPHKQIPTSQLVIVCGDGLGVVDDSKALAVVGAKPGVRADVLAGGYAAWLTDTRLTTAPSGAGPEKLPGITYNQLVAAAKGDMVLVDLRGPAAPAMAAAATGSKQPPVAALAAPDILAQFASKIGVPVVAANGAVARAQSAALSSGKEPVRAAAPPPGAVGSGRLMVLVADSDAAANEAARQLRASGQYRFTILIGGTESIRHEGRVGTGRMDGDLPSGKQ